LGLSSDEDDDDEFDNLDTGDLPGPRYLYRRAQTNGIVEADMLEDENEKGDGGDSDEEGEEGVAIDEAACEALAERMEVITDETNCVLHVDSKHEVPLVFGDDPTRELKLPRVPEEWDPKPAHHKGEQLTTQGAGIRSHSGRPLSLARARVLASTRPIYSLLVICQCLLMLLLVKESLTTGNSITAVGRQRNPSSQEDTRQTRICFQMKGKDF
jgi:hypothetical protein